MEHRAQFRNNITIAAIALIALALIWLKTESKDSHQLWVAAGNPGLVQANGVCYYKNIPLTGCVYVRFADSSLAKQIPYVNGLQDGIMRVWNDNHTLQQQRLFVAGKKQGIHRGWWPNGKLKFEYIFTDDEYNGVVKEWYANSRYFRVFHYTMGHEDGLQQMWWDNGTVRANYVVKDGQQYGLIGRKLCRNLLK
jgi:antitoxin component YwqK of YwqJK toxin-antitoxin module